MATSSPEITDADTAAADALLDKHLLSEQIRTGRQFKKLREDLTALHARCRVAEAARDATTVFAIFTNGEVHVLPREVSAPVWTLCGEGVSMEARALVVRGRVERACPRCLQRLAPQPPPRADQQP